MECATRIQSQGSCSSKQPTTFSLTHDLEQDKHSIMHCSSNLLVSALHASGQSVAALGLAVCCSMSHSSQSLFDCCPDLCYEDDSGGLIQGCAIHVDSCTQGQHKLDDAVLAPRLLCTLHAHLHLPHACQHTGTGVARYR